MSNTIIFPFSNIQKNSNIQKKKCRAQETSSPKEDLRTVSRMTVGLRTAERMWQPVDDKTDLNPEIEKLIPPIQSHRVSAPSLTPKQQNLKKNFFFKMFKIELDPQPALDKYLHSRSFCGFSLPSFICCYFVGTYTDISWGRGLSFIFFSSLSFLYKNIPFSLLRG